MQWKKPCTDYFRKLLFLHFGTHDYHVLLLAVNQFNATLNGAFSALWSVWPLPRYRTTAACRTSRSVWDVAHKYSYILYFHLWLKQTFALLRVKCIQIGSHSTSQPFLSAAACAHAHLYRIHIAAIVFVPIQRKCP